MSEPTTSEAASAATTEDQVIRERVKEFTSQILQQGRVDPEAVRDIVRAVIGPTPGNSAAGRSVERELFADAVREFDAALMESANATHDALQRLAARGQDFTDNDLKEALVALRELERDYAAAATRIAEAMTGNLTREITELAVHAQNVGAEASARVAGMVGEFAGGVGAVPGMATIRDTSVRMALLASGVLAGVADALRGRPETERGP